jgi:hypothetical protein
MVPIVGGDHLQVAAPVDGHPVEDRVVEFGGEAADGEGEARIVRAMYPASFEIDSGVAAGERVDKLDIGRDGARGAVVGEATGDRAFAAVACGVVDERDFELVAEVQVGAGKGPLAI